MAAHDYPDYLPAIQTFREWVSGLGEWKCWELWRTTQGLTTYQYIVPAGKMMYFSDIVLDAYVTSGETLYYGYGYVMVGNIMIGRLSVNAGSPYAHLGMMLPVPAHAGDDVDTYLRVVGADIGTFIDVYAVEYGSPKRRMSEDPVERYKAGAWNFCRVTAVENEWTLYEFRHIRERMIHRFKAKNLYRPDEKIQRLKPKKLIPFSGAP